MKPTRRPHRPFFCSGPCAKRADWKLEDLSTALLGRYHRAPVAKERLRTVIDTQRAMLGMPPDYRLAIVPGSDTGAFEMAMWGLLGPRPVEALAWDSFGQGWATDITAQLKLDAHVHQADYGELPDLGQVDFDADVVFAWNGTTAGVRVPSGDWIPEDRRGLTLCDATSAVFAMDVPWSKLDVVTWSWQKVLGGEAAHGMLALSPRALERLERHTPPWPVPKLMRLVSKGKPLAGLFEGATINTPSMLCVEDCLQNLEWAKRQGGLPGLIARAEANLATVARWVAGTAWADFLARDPATRSCTSICVAVAEPWFLGLEPDRRRAVVKAVARLLEEERVAYDVEGYRDAPPSFRFWGGATVERDDLEAVLPWVDWAYQTVRGAG